MKETKKLQSLKLDLFNNSGKILGGDGSLGPFNCIQWTNFNTVNGSTNTLDKHDDGKTICPAPPPTTP